MVCRVVMQTCTGIHNQIERIIFNHTNDFTVFTQPILCQKFQLEAETLKPSERSGLKFFGLNLVGAGTIQRIHNSIYEFIF